MGIKKTGSGASAAAAGKAAKKETGKKGRVADTGHHGAGAIGLDARTVYKAPDMVQLNSIKRDLEGYDHSRILQFPSALVLLKTQIDGLQNPDDDRDLGLLIALFKTKIKLIEKKPTNNLALFDLGNDQLALEKSNMDKVNDKINAWFAK